VRANRDYAQALAESDNGASEVVYRYGDDLISQSRDATEHYFHVDGLGSTRVLNDASGLVSYAYTVFGETLNQNGASETYYLCTGEQHNETLNQYHLRARYYEQSVRRIRQENT